MSRILLSLLLCCAGAAHGADSFKLSLKPGTYAVGLHVDQQYDRSRVFKTQASLITGKPATGERARPMQVLSWYPAENGGKSMLFRDYLSFNASEADFAQSAEQVRQTTETFLSDAETGGFQGAAKTAAQPMWAVKDAAARKGKFPVVIYAPSFSAAASENADLCEYLASQGYIVLSSASKGSRSRAMTSDIDGVEAQAADIAYLVSYAAKLPQADLDKIAVAGFSWGGLANVVAAAKDDRIKALVSLDGSVRYFPQLVDGGKDAIRYVTPTQLAVPMLFVAARPASIESLSRRGKSTSYSLLNQMNYADRLLVTMHPMEHANFAADGLRFTPDSRFSEYSRAEVSTAYNWMAQYVRRFLDAYLKDDAEARSFLAKKPVDNGVPAHMVEIDMHRGSGTPLTRESFAKQLAARGFDKVGEVYADMKARGATFALDENDINAWGYELLRDGMVKESVAILEFGTQQHPADANLYDSLGEAQAGGGLREEAIRSYRRSLELNPKNDNAVARLKLLEAAVK